MAYDLQLVSCGNIAGFTRANSLAGFPQTFTCFTYSGWYCFGTGGNRGLNFAQTNTFGNIQVSSALSGISINIQFRPGFSQPVFFDGQFSAGFAWGVLTCIQVSVDAATQTIQVYANNMPATLVSGGWIGGPSSFNMGTGPFCDWDITPTGSAAPGPGFGDIIAFSSNNTFYDLSVAANRRYTISASNAPADPAAFGVTCPMWFTVVPTDPTPLDFINNNGTGGAFSTSQVFTFQTPGTCVSPAPPATRTRPLVSILGKSTP